MAPVTITPAACGVGAVPKSRSHRAIIPGIRLRVAGGRVVEAAADLILIKAPLSRAS
jgi:hypothetical protein